MPKKQEKPETREFEWLSNRIVRYCEVPEEHAPGIVKDLSDDRYAACLLSAQQGDYGACRTILNDPDWKPKSAGDE